MLHWMRDKFSSSRQRFFRILNRRNDNEDFVSSNVSDKSRMLVPDSNIFPEDRIKLRIIGIDGDLWTVDANINLIISDLVAMVLGHFYTSIDMSKIVSNYSLISTSLKRELHPMSTVQNEGLSNYDEILLVEKYTPKPPQLQKFNEIPSQGPDEQEIINGTKNLEAKNIKNLPMPEGCLDNFQFEIRKVLITLVEASAVILTTMPNSKEIFQDISSRITKKMEPEKEDIKKCMTLGFTEFQAKYALQIKRNNINEAINWLSENADKVKEDTTEDIPGPSRCDIDKEDPILIIIKLLDILRETRIKNFEPDKDILQSMIEMGYPLEECIDALRITGNCKSSAYEWLIGERKVNVQDIDTGLDTEGPIYKALLKNPTIQFGLHNPKVLLAFLSILVNPTNANIWMNDPDTKPVLNQVFKIHHSEKHMMVVNHHVQQYQPAS